MIFVANALVVNGGTTFLIRMCKSLSAKNDRPAVVLLSERSDFASYQELGKHADIFYVREFLSAPFNNLHRGLLGIFLPIQTGRLQTLISKYGNHFHVMGILGLYWAARLKLIANSFCVSVGIYHQNEFMFEHASTFSKSVRRIFASLADKNIIFLNSFNRVQYGLFYKKDYSHSHLVPVGIEVPNDLIGTQCAAKNKIVLIGNLDNFKTYNRHMVLVTSLLRKKFPHITCDIYGDGPERASLEALIQQLNCSEYVKLKGRLPYKDFSTTVQEAVAFVGSGTAILEAAVREVPAIVGIESLLEPKTYGYIYEVAGFSYNEIMPDVPMMALEDVLTDLLRRDSASQNLIGKSCRRKALEFSIDKTVDGFLAAEKGLSTEIQKVNTAQNILCMLSFCWMALKDVLGIDQEFRLRRNQSS